MFTVPDYFVFAVRIFVGFHDFPGFFFSLWTLLLSFLEFHFSVSLFKWLMLARALFLFYIFWTMSFTLMTFSTWWFPKLSLQYRFLSWASDLWIHLEISLQLPKRHLDPLCKLKTHHRYPLPFLSPEDPVSELLHNPPSYPRWKSEYHPRQFHLPHPEI